MMAFWLVVALMIAGALLFIVPPLLGRGKKPVSAAARSELNLSVYRDQLRELDAELAAGALSKEEYQNARGELEGRVLEDSATDEVAAAPAPPVSGRKLAIATAIAVPVLTVALYLTLGKPGGLDPQNEPEQASQQVTQEQIVAMVEQLAQRLKEKPGDAEGWVMLARSYLALRRFPEAADAYAHAVELVPGNARLLADYADILALNSGRSMQGEPERIIRQALQADPNNVKALVLMGTASFQRKDFRASVEWWNKALQQVPPDSEIAATINANISQAEGLSGQMLSSAQTAGAQKQGGAQAQAVSGSVSLDPALTSKVAGTDTVFVFARDASAPRRPPLAILRKTVKDLPFDFTLDDSMAILPNFKLSSVSSIVVGARISKTGNATPSPGDFEGLSQPVKAGEKGIGIKISSVVN
jgi:cytochrome c-type biogenesis protein CcmH